MVGLLFFIIYLLIGLAISNAILPEKRYTVKLWAAGVIGIVAFMWSNIPFSFIFGFTVISHILGLVLALGLTALIVFLKEKYRPVCAPKKRSILAVIFGEPKSLSSEEKGMLLLILPFMIFGVICIINHSFYEVNGTYYTGQCTYGDMNFHLGIITSLKEQGTFPPDYSICPGEQLDYYFLCDSISSSLYLLGMGLRSAYVFPMFFGFLLVFMGFWILAEAVLKSAVKAHIAFTLFFLNGGFGTFYFLDDLKENKENFTQIFTEYYHTPTNYVNSQGGTTNICWTNTVVDMMLPQRATLFGWMILFFVLYLLYLSVFEREGDGEKENNLFFAAGVFAGLTPMIQTYSYFTVGLVAIAWICYSCIRDKFSWKTIKSWLYFGIPALAISIPQLMIWVFGAVDGESFIEISFNAYNESDNWLWFWVKNVGIVFILLVPAFMNAAKKMKHFYIAGIVIFVVTEFVKFQTWAYDNNKLYLMWYALSTIIVADFLVEAYGKMAGIKGRGVVAVIIMVLATNAAILTMGREMYSGFRPQSYEIYNKKYVQAAEYIENNTEPDSLFLCYNNHNNAIACLTGRNIFVGAGTFLASHDVGYREREQALESIFTDAEVFEEYKAEYGFDYVYISDYERSNFRSDTFIEDYLEENYEKVYDASGVVIYKL